MKALKTQRFNRQYVTSPREVQDAFDKQLGYLLQNIRHPSLRAKKYDLSRNLWQARVTRGWRFYFTIEDDAYYLVDITPHPK